MNRDEQELVNVFNSVNNLAGTFARTRAQGLQTDELLKEKADKERGTAIDNRMTTGLYQGENTDDLSKVSTVQTPTAVSAYSEMNRGLSPTDKDFVPIKGFSASSDINVGPGEVSKGLTSALSDKVIQDKARVDNRANYLLENVYSKMPIQDLQRVDPNALGPDALPARVALGKAFLNYSGTEEAKKSANEMREAVAKQNFEKFKAGLSEANRLLSNGNRKGAAKVLSHIVNYGNNSAYKAAELPNDNIQLYMTKNGVDEYSKNETTPEQLFKMLSDIKETEFVNHHFLAAQDAVKQNADSLKDQLYFTNGKNVLTAIKETNPNTFEFNHAVYDTKTNQPVPFKSAQELIAAGYKQFDPIKQRERELEEKLMLSRIRGSELDNKRREISNRNASMKSTEEKNIQLIRDKRKEATKAFAQDLWSKGIEVNFDPDTGEINIDKNTMLTQAQKDMVDKVASQYGFNASLRPVEDGIDNGWFRDDTVGYRFGGVSGFEAPGAKGLSRPGTNQGKSGPVMSRGEFDATITGQENKQPPVKTGKGLIERAYNSVVPADGFADTVVKKGFGPIPGQAKELAGVVYEKGLKPIPGQVKGVAKAVAKPFAAPYSAAAKLTKLKVLKNQLSHAESDKEKKEIKAEIEALSKSK